MFKKKVRDVLRKLNLTSNEYNLIVSLYGNYICHSKPFKGKIDYHDLYKLTYHNSVYVFQNKDEKTVLNMDPFSNAIVICRDWSTKLCKIYEFNPQAFTQVLVLRNIDDIKYNFNIYTVVTPDGNKISRFEDLRNCEEFIAISKQSFCGRTKYGHYTDEYPIHMLLRWRKPSIKHIY